MSGPWTLWGYWRRDHSSGEEYVDLDTLSHDRDGADTCRKKGDLRRQWAARNPVLRRAQFELREVE